MPVSVYRVAIAPAKPLVLFDGDCRFCRHWANRWQKNYGPRLEVESAQQAGPRFPEIPTAAFDAALQLIEPDGRVHAGAAAVLRARAHGTGRRGLLLRLYEGVPWLAPLFEAGYRLVARNRQVFSFFMR